MRAPLTSPTELTKRLHATAVPMYLLDDRRRVVFCNQACAAWAEIEPHELLGRECRYHSAPALDRVEVVAAALCPPPEVFLGQRARAVISMPGSAQGVRQREAEFLPLVGAGDEVASVLACLSAIDLSPEAMVSRAATDAPEALHALLARFHAELAARYQPQRLVGESPLVRRARAQIALAAQGAARVLIVGPSGSGRQHVARSIHHAAGTSVADPLVSLPCDALGPELLAASLDTLWTSPPQAQARRGTLILTNVDRLAPELQAELAPQLLSGSAPLRVLSTARVPLMQLALEGGFRADLACWLSTLVIELPSLAARPQDIPLLAQAIVEEVNAEGGKQLAGFSPEALDCLAAYPWPGNVDELAEAVRRAHAQAEGRLITGRDLPRRLWLALDARAQPRRAEEKIILQQFLGEIELELIRRALAQAKGNKTKAAELLGMTRPRLYRRLVQLGLVDTQGESPPGA